MTLPLAQGQEKMSKSDPNSAIFMEDSEGDVNVKIKKAFCPPQVRGMSTEIIMMGGDDQH